MKKKVVQKAGEIGAEYIIGLLLGAGGLAYLLGKKGEQPPPPPTKEVEIVDFNIR